MGSGKVGVRYGTPPAERLPQRRLAVELRYAIDVAIRAEEQVRIGNVAPASSALSRVRELIIDHPQGILSEHVRHNLGPTRLNWLRKRGLIG